MKQTRSLREISGRMVRLSLATLGVLYAFASFPRMVVGEDALPADTVLEQGKTLYDKGEYPGALDRFMKVLRRDPQHPEAREYLKLVVEKMRYEEKTSPNPAKKKGLQLIEEVDYTTPAPAAKAKTEPVPAVLVDEEVRMRVQKRELLTLDLGAIPGVKVKVNNKLAQVEIQTSMLFTDKTGGLKEEGILILDRVSAWLKTFGAQPISIHCYPEEFQPDNSALFVHRFAQLYGFFVDERKLPATRFVNSQVTKGDDAAAEAASETNLSSATARVVITSIGGGSLVTDASLASQPGRWLEFSIAASHAQFNPEHGDWASLDLSALTRKGLRNWSFQIQPADKGGSVMRLEGKGNLLKRVSWDGRDQKTGSFVPAGKYVAQLIATDGDGQSSTQEIALSIKRTGQTTERVVQTAQKPTKAPANKPAKSLAEEVTDLADMPTVESAATPAPLPKPATLSIPVAARPQTPVAAPKPEPEVEAEPEPEPEPDDSTQSIWKQVIQFDANDSDLKPTLKASLERIGKTLEVYPLQKVRIMGFADDSETNPSKLARQRAERVRETLIREYQVDARRVIVAGGKVGSGSEGRPMSKAEISITN